MEGNSCSLAGVEYGDPSDDYPVANALTEKGTQPTATTINRFRTSLGSRRVPTIRGHPGGRGIVGSEDSSGKVFRSDL